MYILYRVWGPPREGARRACSGGVGGGGGPLGGVEILSQRDALLHVNEMLGGIDPHGLCCRRADLYDPLSNRFSFEAKLVEHSGVEQAACKTLK
jgi:hypothetical protein